MRVKLTAIALVFLLLAMAIPTSADAGNKKSVIDDSQVKQGIIIINFTTKSNAYVKITKNNITYDYAVVDGGRYPLQSGNGTYTIVVGEEANNNKYKVISRKKVKLALKEDSTVFLQSTEMVNWLNEQQVNEKSKELTRKLKTDEEKIRVIYKYVITNFTYDYEKEKKVTSGYVPDINEIIKAQTGICYDYTIVTAALLRSAGIPTKLLMGYSENSEIYHAWNQVYLKDEDKWVIIDTTYDSILYKAGIKTTLRKSSDDYVTEKVY
jgi:transglutaminase-like putative cysteine protease